VLVATTEYIPHNLNPVWKTVTVTVRHGLPVKIKCWDKVNIYIYDKTYDNDIIIIIDFDDVA
jgi:hypothetical protein